MSDEDEDQKCLQCGEPLGHEPVSFLDNHNPARGGCWLVAYTLGLLCWLAIARLWGAVVVVAMIAGGLFGTLAIADWLHETNRPRPPVTEEERR